MPLRGLVAFRSVCYPYFNPGSRALLNKFELHALLSQSVLVEVPDLPFHGLLTIFDAYVWQTEAKSTSTGTEKVPDRLTERTGPESLNRFIQIILNTVEFALSQVTRENLCIILRVVMLCDTSYEGTRDWLDNQALF